MYIHLKTCICYAACYAANMGISSSLKQVRIPLCPYKNLKRDCASFSAENSLSSAELNAPVVAFIYARLFAFAHISLLPVRIPLCP
ncbi:MAG: hypothetical protein ACD_8C00138G0018 [uncultured bacterium]|nr:MAG: hypothetical protein ACD_8C00138G0018 [uncultured bacterium]